MKADETCWRQHYPFKSRWATIGGHRYHYIDEGAGEPIVCVHGNPTWSFYFRNLVLELRKQFRVIAVDHIGCGLSDTPPLHVYDYTLKNRIDDFEQFLDGLKLTRNVTFAMHDWGGMIGMGAALRRIDRISRLVLMNTAAFLLPEGKPLPPALWLVRNVDPMARLLLQGLNLFTVGANTMASARGLSPSISAGYKVPYDSWSNRIAVRRFVQDIPVKPGDPSYDDVKWIDDHLEDLTAIPKLICWGEQDFVFDLDFLAEWRRRCPEASVHTFPSAGHYCLEDDGEQIVTLVREFLNRNPIHAIQPALVGSAK
ncbi:MAG: alpha/beta hydrolase [Phycisphaerae bacterium]|nr:MAG: alpha/beta hydrolase [Phycisphaerae bacterium]